MKEYSYPPEKVKILLLEGVSKEAVERFESAGYAVEALSRALSPDELAERIGEVHVLGIRSKTEVRAEVLQHAKSLLAIGCFCIGTNQVDLDAAALRGVPVFNAPFSNTRSVAELAVAEIIMLARRASHKSDLLHRGVWEKSATGCTEVRQKTLGIIGYGHIGPQIGLLAEALGMRVLFYDIVPKLPLGNALSVETLGELLAESDFVTLHVPETELTKDMIGDEQLRQMRRGSHLLNLSRGSIVAVDALVHHLREGHLAGAAIDVFPEEPSSNDEPFVSPLCGLPNVILTPHIGGSTVEAQRNIGLETSAALLKFIEIGSTTGAVNFPSVEVPVVHGSHRVLNCHRNVPGVLRAINEIVAELGVNIQRQSLATLGDVGYLIMDVDKSLSSEVKSKIDALPDSIKTRLLF
jgi:D-3-phosphoglycerate dehydrogenase